MRKLLCSPYALWLGLGFLFAFAGIGFDSPDEHFPTLEVAGRFLFGRYTRTWEWDAGLRSFLQPLILTAWLKPFVALGLESRPWLDSLARALNVIWFLPCIWAAGRISGKTAQWWMASCWPLLAWGTRHGSDTFGIPPLMAGLAILLSGPSKPLMRVLAGAILGFAFELRFTTGVISVLGVGVAVFCIRKLKLREGLLAGAGFVGAAAALGATDWLLYSILEGSGKLPPWQYLIYILDGGGRFHSSPWYELIVDGLLIWMPPLGWLALPRIRRAFRGPESWAALTWIGTSLVLACVRHKELRFILPLLPLSCLATASLLKANETRVAAAGNALVIGLLLLLYRDPHGSLVRALDAASVAGNGSYQDLWIAGVSADFPEFYVRRKMNIHFISGDEARAVCTERRRGVLIGSEACSSCELIREIEPGLGHRLRQHVSTTPAFRYVYRCS